MTVMQTDLQDEACCQTDSQPTADLHLRQWIDQTGKRKDPDHQLQIWMLVYM